MKTDFIVELETKPMVVCPKGIKSAKTAKAVAPSKDGSEKVILITKKIKQKFVTPKSVEEKFDSAPVEIDKFDTVESAPIAPKDSKDEDTEEPRTNSDVQEVLKCSEDEEVEIG
ncbi:hypothetical protein ADUPG1_000800, partial [Aduncisulcus paluster]